MVQPELNMHEEDEDMENTGDEEGDEDIENTCDEEGDEEEGDEDDEVFYSAIEPVLDGFISREFTEADVVHDMQLICVDMLTVPSGSMIDYIIGVMYPGTTEAFVDEKRTEWFAALRTALSA